MPADPRELPPPLTRLEVERDGERYEVHAAMQFDVPARLLWDTLTDYERVPDFMPGVVSSRVVARAGRQVTVEHRGEFGLLFVRRPVRVRLVIDHSPFTEIVGRAQPRLADGSASTFRDFEGRYTLAVVAGGRAQLAYDASFQLADPLPPVLGPLFGSAVLRSRLRADFEALGREVERRRAAQPAISRGAPR